MQAENSDISFQTHFRFKKIKRGRIERDFVQKFERKCEKKSFDKIGKNLQSPEIN